MTPAELVAEIMEVKLCMLCDELVDEELRGLCSKCGVCPSCNGQLTGVEWDDTGVCHLCFEQGVSRSDVDA